MLITKEQLDGASLMVALTDLLLEEGDKSMAGVLAEMTSQFPHLLVPSSSFLKLLGVKEKEAKVLSTAEVRGAEIIVTLITHSIKVSLDGMTQQSAYDVLLKWEHESDGVDLGDVKSFVEAFNPTFEGEVIH